MEALKLDLPRRSMVGQRFVYWVSPNADQLREGNLTGQKFRTSDMLPTNGWQSKSPDLLSFRLSQKHVVPQWGLHDDLFQTNHYEFRSLSRYILKIC